MGIYHKITCISFIFIVRDTDSGISDKNLKMRDTGIKLKSTNDMNVRPFVFHFHALIAEKIHNNFQIN